MTTRQVARHRSDARPVTPISDFADTAQFRAISSRGVAVASATGLALTAAVASTATAESLPSVLPQAPSGDFVSNLQVTDSATLVSLDIKWDSGDEFAVKVEEPDLEPEPVVVEAATRDYDRNDQSEAVDEYVSTPPPAASASGVVATALQYVGYPYVYGASGPNAFDCSGFTQYIFGLHGIALPRTSYDQGGAGTIVSAADAQPGDLVILNGGGHVAIYMGDGQIVHASTPATGVKISGLYGSYYFVRI